MGSHREATMSETTWVLKGIDSAARQQAIDEAARRGVSLADHLTDIVLQNALAEQMRGHGAALLAESEAENDIRMPTEEPREAFAIRHRLKALEKRLSASVGSIDGTLHALDTALFDLTTRLGDVEALAGDSAHSFAQALQELQGNLAALRIQLEDAELAVSSHAESNLAAHQQLADACGELDQRIDGVEHVARGAEGAAASLAIQQEALRDAVAADLNSITQQTTERLGECLDHVRAAADAAARHADAAAAHMVNELRAVREALDARIEESSAETKSRMHAAFIDAADRMAALADRILETERTQTRSAEQLRAEIANAEDAAQTALEETADTLRRTDAHLAADLIRARDAAHAGIEGVRAELGRETEDLRDRHLGALARLAQVEAALAVAGDETEDLRNSIAIRIAALTASTQESVGQAESAFHQRFDAIAARIRDTDDGLDHARRTLSADVNRVEACTLAALEKLNDDRVAGDAALARDLDGVFTATRASIADLRQNFETEVAALRGQDASMQARLDVVDMALTAITPLQIAVAEIPALKAAAVELNELRDVAAEIPALKTAAAAIPALQAALARIEGASPDRTFETDAAARLGQLERALAAQLASQHDAPAALSELRAQIATLSNTVAAQESLAGEAADNLHDVARMLTRLSTQSAEAETDTRERLHKLEVGFADLRLSQLAATDHADKASIDTIAIINSRLADMENRGAAALSELQAQISAFISEYERRVAALESAPKPAALPDQPFAHIEARLDELELRDLGAEFIELRRRIDDRILGLERRSIEALERVCDSVAAIEERLSHKDDDRASQSA
jgi:hypothetical protein